MGHRAFPRNQSVRGFSLWDLLRRLRDWLVYLVVRVLVCLVQAVRMETCAVLAHVMSRLFCDVLRCRHKVVDDNLRHAFPHWSAAQRLRVTRRMWEHLFLMVCEIAHAPRKIHETNWRGFISFTGKREFVIRLLDPRPKVLVTGHFGNFEAAGYVSGLLGFPTFTIARPLDNPFLHRFLTDFRRATGQFMLPTKGSAQQVQAVLDAGGTLGLLGDQYAGPKGCWVEFFGRPASCHKALALFSLVHGAPLIVVYAKRGTRPLRFQLGIAGVSDPADPDNPKTGVRELTQWYNTLLEDAIRTAPDQYWWLHRRWKEPADRPRKRRARAVRRQDLGWQQGRLQTRGRSSRQQAPGR
jgi:KDO2-lipid IV(A) lauroyltransferase